MLLAGVLLKLGGVGLVRLSELGTSSLQDVLMGYRIILIPLATAVCCIQADFKRIIAYSSVRHIIILPLLHVRGLGIRAILIVMLFHGLSSPLLFSIVGRTYSKFRTRQIVALRGLAILSPLLSLVMIAAFFYTLAAPPFPSFIAEIGAISSCMHLRISLVTTFFLLAGLSLLYNLN